MSSSGETPYTHTHVHRRTPHVSCALNNTHNKLQHTHHTHSYACARDKSRSRALYIYTGHAGTKSSAPGAPASPVGAVAQAMHRAAERLRHDTTNGKPRRTVVEAVLNEHRTSCTCAHCGAPNIGPPAHPHRRTADNGWEAGQVRRSYRWRVCPCRVWELDGEVPVEDNDAPVIPATASGDTIKAARVHRDNNAVHNMLRQAHHMHTSRSTAAPRLTHLQHGQAGRDGSTAALRCVPSRPVVPSSMQKCTQTYHLHARAWHSRARCLHYAHDRTQHMRMI